MAVCLPFVCTAPLAKLCNPSNHSNYPPQEFGGLNLTVSFYHDLNSFVEDTCAFVLVLQEKVKPG